MRRALARFFALAVGAYVALLLRDAGAFRSIRARGGEGCFAIAGIPGPEDLVRIGVSGLLVSASPFPRVGSAPDGALYYLDHPGAGAVPRRMDAAYPAGFHPHGIDAIPTPDGAYLVAVVNHATVGAEESDEIDFFRFDPRKPELVFERRVRDPLLGNSTNDVVLTGTDRFYATVDHAATTHLGKTAEDFLRLGRGSVVHYDGARLSTAFRGVAFANGIVRLPGSGDLVVASMLGKKILRFAEVSPGELVLREATPLEAGPDNLFYDPKSRALWIGAHPKLLDLKRASKDSDARSPSMVLRIPEFGTNRAGRVETVFADPGERISAVSTAVVQAGVLVLGAVYGDRLLVCPLAKAPAGGS